MMKLTEIYAVLKAHSDVLKHAQEVASKQRDVKRAAIDKVVEHYERAVEANKKFECWFKLVPDYRCKKCGGVIMKVVGPFQTATIGGNQAIGCIHCSTVGSGKMLALRTDIERVDRKQA